MNINEPGLGCGATYHSCGVPCQLEDGVRQTYLIFNSHRWV